MTLKMQRYGSTSNELRDQHTSERADWTSALSGDIGVSLTVSLSADCVPFGGRVSHDDNPDATQRGHDE